MNKFIAQATGISRRSADAAVKSGRVTINGRIAVLGDKTETGDTISLDNEVIALPLKSLTIILNKPAGYICSRRGQGSKTIYELLPKKYHHLKPAGRLDKGSSGLLVLTDDGNLAQELTHPSYQKKKIYLVELNKTLELSDKNKLLTGVELRDGLSKFINVKDYSDPTYEVILAEGKNRQIRRTFNALGYKVTKLHRISFGPYSLLRGPTEGKWIHAGL